MEALAQRDEARATKDMHKERQEEAWAELEAHMDGCGRTTYSLAKSAERAEAEVVRLWEAVEAWRKAESAVECEACAVFGATRDAVMARLRAEEARKPKRDFEERG
jgi:hypothetical protein